MPQLYGSATLNHWSSSASCLQMSMKSVSRCFPHWILTCTNSFTHMNEKAKVGKLTCSSLLLAIMCSAASKSDGDARWLRLTFASLSSRQIIVEITSSDQYKQLDVLNNEKTPHSIILLKTQFDVPSCAESKWIKCQHRGGWRSRWVEETGGDDHLLTAGCQLLDSDLHHAAQSVL